MRGREAAAERERKAAAAMLRLAGKKAQAEGQLGALQLQQEGLRLGRLSILPSGPLGGLTCPSSTPWPRTMIFGCTARVLAECKLKFYRISNCLAGRALKEAKDDCSAAKLWNG